MMRIIIFISALCMLAPPILAAGSTANLSNAPANMESPSWRHMLIPEVQEITDRILELRNDYERGQEKISSEFFRSSDQYSASRTEEIARRVRTRVQREFNERSKARSVAAPECTSPFCGNLTEKDIADMMYCRFGQSVRNCPRPEFVRQP